MVNDGIFTIVAFNIKHLYYCFAKLIVQTCNFCSDGFLLLYNSYQYIYNCVFYCYEKILSKTENVKNLISDKIIDLCESFYNYIIDSMQKFLIFLFFQIKKIFITILLTICNFQDFIFIGKKLIVYFYRFFINKIYLFEKLLLKKLKSRKGNNKFFILPYIVSRIAVYRFLYYFLCYEKLIKYSIYVVKFLENLINKTIYYFYWFFYNLLSLDIYLNIILFFIRKIIFIDKRLFN